MREHAHRQKKRSAKFFTYSFLFLSAQPLLRMTAAFYQHATHRHQAILLDIQAGFRATQTPVAPHSPGGSAPGAAGCKAACAADGPTCRHPSRHNVSSLHAAAPRLANPTPSPQWFTSQIGLNNDVGKNLLWQWRVI